MARETVEIGVIVERRVSKSQWIDHVWMPMAVLAGAPSADPWTILAETPESTRYFAGTFILEFFRTETAMYRDNLGSGRPSLWVSLRTTSAAPGITLNAVTADPSEGEAMTEPGTDIIEALAMPAEIQERLAAFVAAHHVERPFFKRKRDRANPEALAARAVGLESTEEKP